MCAVLRRLTATALAAATTWLRIAHDLVPGTGEHRYRAASSTAGRHWVWGAAWTLPADSTPRIGPVSQGSTPEAEARYGKATARFDYFHVLRQQNTQS